ncbi:MAG: hypothetical protein HQ567_25560 [Candidatus Nealsonbacteria bacterium]|nr:hypothetical protein [Candidatus Nealsonbacteria bacterium]
MKTRCLILAVGLCLWAAVAARAFDTIKTTSSTSITCKVTAVSWKEVGYDQRGVPGSVPVNEVFTIFFEGEPSSMNTARTHLTKALYQEALDSFNKVKTEDITNEWIAQDVVFYKAFCAAKLALGGTGDVVEAGKKMLAFAGQHTTSYHYLEACEVLGDLLVAAGKFSAAEAYYGRVAKAPWPDFQMRARVSMGMALLAQGTAAKTAQAEQLFNSVLAMNVEGDLAKAQKMKATLGKARCQVDKDAPAAIAAVKRIIADADPEAVEMHALAYNTLGVALLKAGNDGEALLAFLHVHVLYFNVPNAHGEALFHLTKLWTKMGKADRARTTKKLLQDRYPNSRWTQTGGA